MHIPSEMLEGTICPVTAAVSALGVGGAAVVAVRERRKPTAFRFGAIAAFIFAAQMINFPIQQGTSGHLLGGVLASALLGTPFGILAMTLVLTIQCLVFSDGGLAVLGANVLNMAMVGAGLGGLLRARLVQGLSVRSLLNAALTGAVAWLSVAAAALACSLELGLSGTIPFANVVHAMLGTHMLIGIGEGLITLAAYYAFAEDFSAAAPKWTPAIPLAASILAGTILSPFASGFPDGLEWVAEKYKFFHDAAPAFVAPFPDYTVPVIHHAILSTAVAGLAGVLVTFLLAWMLRQGLAFSASKK